MAERMANQRMMVDEWSSHHVVRHLIQVSELGRHAAREAVGVEALGWGGEGVAIVSHTIVYTPYTAGEWLRGWHMSG